MRFDKAALTLAAIALPLPALGQTVSDAFECKLPYRPTMETAGKLKVLKQGKPINMVLGHFTTVDFEPGSTRIFGQAPTRLMLTMFEPMMRDEDEDGVDDNKHTKEFTMTFEAQFAETAATDAALLSAVPWKQPCRAEIKLCHRVTDPAGSGRLRLFRHDQGKLRLECEFRLREKDVQ